MTKDEELREQARRLADTVTTWADLSNALFDPHTGLLAQAYPTRPEREAFVRTDEYRRIQELLGQAMNRFGRVEGATPTSVSGLMVPMPQGWPPFPSPTR